MLCAETNRNKRCGFRSVFTVSSKTSLFGFHLKKAAQCFQLHPNSFFSRESFCLVGEKIPASAQEIKKKKQKRVFGWVQLDREFCPAESQHTLCKFMNTRSRNSIQVGPLPYYHCCLFSLFFSPSIHALLCLPALSLGISCMDPTLKFCTLLILLGLGINDASCISPFQYFVD